MTLRLASAPVSWGIWEQTIERPDLVPPEALLATVRAMGYHALESGPPGYLSADGAGAVELLAAYELDVVATFLPLRLDDDDGFREDLAMLDRAAEVLEAAGGGVVLLAAAERPERAVAAGQPELVHASMWAEATFERAAERLDVAVERCAARGLRAALHPHAATQIESVEEVEAVLARTTSALGLCLDTGHAVVGGGDPVALARRHAQRLVHLHLKDVDAAVLARLRAGEIDMDEAWRLGIFCPFGEGVAPLREFLSLLEIRNLDGFAVLEQDRIAVTVDDLPAVRAIEEQNLRLVRAWLT